MEVLGISARASHICGNDLVTAFNNNVLSLILGSQPTMTLTRRFVATWIFLYVGAIAVYFTFASFDYFIYYVLLGKRIHGEALLKTLNIRREISMSVKSLILMSAMSAPAEILIQFGYSKEYTDPAEYGYLYLILSPLLFIAFSDCIIYFIHRALHTRWLYRHVHKPHHSFVNTSPFAAFAFHPVDGYMQGVSYHIFVFLFPFHSVVHLLSLVAVSMWTINIHDRVNFAIPGVNGAGHHTIHHTTYKSNYGQYTILWDSLFGTYRDPLLWKKQGAPTLSEKQVYGKDS